jgi:IS4 transposase
VWRIHSAFDLPGERFGFFELTDEKGGERLDRIPVASGEIRIGDRAYLQPDRIGEVLAAGADIVVRAGWRNARWLDADGKPADLLAILREGAKRGLIDQPIYVARKLSAPLALRLVAIRKSPQAIEAARRKARREAVKGQHHISNGTLLAAEWIILLTSLTGEEFTAADVLALYRLRWRIELAFNRSRALWASRGPLAPTSARPSPICLPTSS